MRRASCAQIAEVDVGRVLIEPQRTDTPTRASPRSPQPSDRREDEPPVACAHEPRFELPRVLQIARVEADAPSR